MFPDFSDIAFPAVGGLNGPSSRAGLQGDEKRERGPHTAVKKFLKVENDVPKSSRKAATIPVISCRATRQTRDIKPDLAGQ